MSDSVSIIALAYSNRNDKPYLTHIKSLSSAWPTLRHLADFLEVGTTPLRWNFMKDEERNARLSRIKLAVIDFSTTGTPTDTRYIKDDAALKALMLETPQPSRNPMRLFIVEDLSQRVVEAFGQRFDIDPAFFRDQIDDYVSTPVVPITPSTHPVPGARAALSRP